FFFFQAEDGIRDWSVTGVQTCALPICWRQEPAGSSQSSRRASSGVHLRRFPPECCRHWASSSAFLSRSLRRRSGPTTKGPMRPRSEERRVGKEWRYGGGEHHGEREKER